MIHRTIEQELRTSATEYPVVTILGPRQAGKTTLARMCFPEYPWISLEDPDVRLASEADPRGFLAQWPKGVILDEVQRVPALLSYLQGMVDRNKTPGRFILTGSHQPALHQAISQSLAGRTAILKLWPFSCEELRYYGPLPDSFTLMLKGFYPRVHEDHLDAARYYANYVQTYVERDVRALIQVRDLNLFQKFLTLLAGRTGQLLNYASLSNDVGVSTTTLRNWLSVLKASFILFELPPFFENVHKRVIKSSKVYFVDVGLAAFLLGIQTPDQLMRDPLRGNLYENLIIAEVYKQLQNTGQRPELYFYRDSHGNEVDLLIRQGGKLQPIEIKSSATFTRAFLDGLKHFATLGIAHTRPGIVFYNGEQDYQIEEMRIMNPLQQDVMQESLFHG